MILGPQAMRVTLDKSAMDALNAIRAGITDLNAKVADLDEDLDELSTKIDAQTKILAEIRDILVTLTTPPAPGPATQVVLTLGKPVPQVLTI